jgi:hypothetical protein
MRWGSPAPQPPTLAGRCAALALLLVVSGAEAASPLPVCAPEVVGTWKLVTTSQPESMLLKFASDGWANVLSGPADRPPASFEIVAQVRYAPVPPREPKRVEFQTRRGNDLFPSGKSHWSITAYTDESLTTQPSDAVGEQSLWTRVQTQRYFLTLAARAGSAQQEPAAFVMWTTLGHKTLWEALGLTGERSQARLGRVSDKLAREFLRYSGSTADVMMRIELSEADYRRTHRVLEAWDAVLQGDRLARNDPVLQFNEMLEATLQGVNRCAIKIKLPPAGSALPLERIRTIRTLNDKRHLNDKIFPFDWRPAAVG